MASIAILGTLDSKSEEHSFLSERIREYGHKTVFIDVGTGGDPKVEPDYSRYDVVASIGLDLDALMQRHDRENVSAMSEAAPAFLAKLVGEGRVDGVISSEVVEELRHGSHEGSAYRISQVDGLNGRQRKHCSLHGYQRHRHDAQHCRRGGLNRISRTNSAAGAICGMVEAKIDTEEAAYRRQHVRQHDELRQ